MAGKNTIKHTCTLCVGYKLHTCGLHYISLNTDTHTQANIHKHTLYISRDGQLADLLINCDIFLDNSRYRPIFAVNNNRLEAIIIQHRSNRHLS